MCLREVLTAGLQSSFNRQSSLRLTLISQLPCSGYTSKTEFAGIRGIREAGGVFEGGVLAESVPGCVSTATQGRLPHPLCV